MIKTETGGYLNEGLFNIIRALLGKDIKVSSDHPLRKIEKKFNAALNDTIRVDGKTVKVRKYLDDLAKQHEKDHGVKF